MFLERGVGGCAKGCCQGKQRADKAIIVARGPGKMSVRGRARGGDLPLGHVEMETAAEVWDVAPTASFYFQSKSVFLLLVDGIVSFLQTICCCGYCTEENLLVISHKKDEL